MKKMRRLIPAIAMLLVSAVMLSTASFAWFTISTTAKAEGMSVSAIADSSLLIVTAGGNTEEKFLTSNGVASFTENDKAGNLKPATHYDANLHKDENGGAFATAPESGLVYLKNTEDIDPSTGNLKAKDEDGNDIVGKYVAADTNYYKDFIVYIGTAGGEMPGTLSATVTSAATDMSQLHNAIAIDFLTATTTTTTDEAGEEKVTTTALTYTGKTVWLEEAKADGGKVVSLGSFTIPESIATRDGEVAASYTGNHFVVVMRVYFDGAYQAASGGAFVKDSFKTDNFCGFNVKFDIAKSQQS